MTPTTITSKSLHALLNEVRATKGMYPESHGDLCARIEAHPLFGKHAELTNYVDKAGRLCKMYKLTRRLAKATVVLRDTELRLLADRRIDDWFNAQILLAPAPEPLAPEPLAPEPPTIPAATTPALVKIVADLQAALAAALAAIAICDPI